MNAVARGSLGSRSLIRRTVTIVVLAQVASALVLSGVALLHERNIRLRAIDVRLMGRSDSLLGALRDREDIEDTLTVDTGELKLPSADLYAVYNSDGVVIGEASDPMAASLRRSREGFREERIDRVRYRVYERRAVRILDREENNGAGVRRLVTIVYASPESFVWHEIFEATAFDLFTIAVVVVAMAISVVLLLRKTLAPLRDLAAATAQLSAPALVFEAPPSVLRVLELRPLAEVLSTIVESLRVAFARERRFVGDAAHELKTAVAVVRSTVQVLMLRPRSVPEYQAGLDRILEDNRRVEALIAQMLSTAAAEAAVPLEVVPIDLVRGAKLALEQVRPIAVAHGVELRCESRGAAEVRLSVQQATVLVSNLVMNAVQHSQPGGSVEVAIGRSAAGRIEMTVTDAGAGIGADALPHVFERFYREDRSRSRDTGGAGLGLAICKAIVEGAGGEIGIASKPGEGTTVRVVFIGG